MLRCGRIGRVVSNNAVTVDFDVQTLAAQAKQFGGRSAIVAGQFQRRFNAQPLNRVGRFAHQFLQRAPVPPAPLIDPASAFVRG